MTYVVGQKFHASDLPSDWVSYDIVGTTWTGASSNPAIGNGTFTAKYKTLGGNLILYVAYIVTGTTTTYGSGTWRFGLPFNASSDGQFMTGSCETIRTGVSEQNGIVRLDDSRQDRIIAVTTDDSASGAGQVNSTFPFSWSGGNQGLRITLLYEKA